MRTTLQKEKMKISERNKNHIRTTIPKTSLEFDICFNIRPKRKKDNKRNERERAVTRS